MESKEQGKQGEQMLEAMDHVAKVNGWDTWKELVKWHQESGLGHEVHEDYVKEVAESYASLRVSEAVDAKDKEIAELKEAINTFDNDLGDALKDRDFFFNKSEEFRAQLEQAKNEAWGKACEETLISLERSILSVPTINPAADRALKILANNLKTFPRPEYIGSGSVSVSTEKEEQHTKNR